MGPGVLSPWWRRSGKLWDRQHPLWVMLRNCVRVWLFWWMWAFGEVSGLDDCVNVSVGSEAKWSWCTQRGGESRLSRGPGTASLCSQRALEEFTAFVLLLSHTGLVNQGSTNSTNMWKTLWRSVGGSNKRKVWTKEQVYFLFMEEPFCLTGTYIGVLHRWEWGFSGKILFAVQCNYLSTSPFQTYQ